MTDHIQIALAEEIGDARFFTGREEEMRFYLDWAEGSKRLHSKSQALLSRRKMGKTALVQRLYNILFSRNDPKLVPFYFRVPETAMSSAAFGEMFYCTFVAQFLAFRERKPELVNEPPTLKRLKEMASGHSRIMEDIQAIEELSERKPELVWSRAQSAAHRMATGEDIRIIQIIDEFQYMNRYIFSDTNPSVKLKLCHSYMGLAESKYAPLLVTGSYIGWLTRILHHMTARFEDRKLHALSDGDALAAVYNYAALTGRSVTETTAPYIAEVAYNDPFYISQLIRTSKRDLDLTTREGVRDALQYETTLHQGYIASVWMEYIVEGIDQINDQNGKKIVLYLAKHGDKEITRDQIAKDLNIDDAILADRLYKLKHADLIAPGASEFRFKGLGDPIFEAVFRKRYAEEIERVTPEEVTASFEERMKTAQRQAAWYKGLAGEYRVMYYLLMAINRGAAPEDVVFNVQPGFTLNGYVDMKKRSFHGDQSQVDEVDILGTAKDPADADLIAEVKTWERPVTQETVQRFVDLKQRLVGQLERPTVFLFYSEQGFTEGSVALLEEHGVMYSSFDKLVQ